LLRLTKEGFWVALGQATAVVGSILGVRLLTELLSPTAYGELALGMTLASLVNQTVFGPLGNGLTRFYAPAVEQGDLGGYLVAARRLVVVATVIVVLIIPLEVAGLLISGLIDWVIIISAALIFAVLSGYNSILSGIQNAARQRSIVALHQGAASWMRILVAAGFILLLGSASSVAMLGYVVAIVMVLGSQYAFFRKTISVHISCENVTIDWRDRVLKYSWPMAITGVASWGLLSSQLWAVKLFGTTSDVGYFSVLLQLGFTPLMLAGGILTALITPIFFARAGDGTDKQKVNIVAGNIIKFCVVAFIAVLIMTAIGGVFHDLVFSLFVAEKYRIFSHYLPFAILAGGVLQVSICISIIVLTSTETKLLLPLNTVGNLIIASINFGSTYLFGINGLFFSIVIGAFIHLVWNVYNARNVLKKNYNHT